MEQLRRLRLRWDSTDLFTERCNSAVPLKHRVEEAHQLTCGGLKEGPDVLGRKLSQAGQEDGDVCHDGLGVNAGDAKRRGVVAACEPSCWWTGSIDVAARLSDCRSFFI